jgi:hypothetical protein
MKMGLSSGCTLLGRGRWASKNFPTPDNQFQYKAPGKPIPYEELDLEQGWETFNKSLRAKASRNSLLTIVPRYPDPHSEAEL